MKNKLLIVSLSLASFVSFAQEETIEETAEKGRFTLGLESNSQWYIDDDKVKISPEDAVERFRSNSYLKGDYFIKNWEFGMQLEAYAPMALLNYSPELEKVNIGTVYARYNNTDLGLDVTAGHFYEQFGSGLILRSWEDRQLGINNAIFGGKVSYNLFNSSKITILGGKQRIGMGFDLADSFISGADLELNLSEIASIESTDLTFGASYVGRHEEVENLNPDLKNATNAYSVRLDMAKGNFYAGAEYVYKTEDALVEYGEVKNTNIYDGNALLFNFGYSKKGFGLDANLRRIQNMSFYSERELAGNAFNQGVVNYIPALTKQYDFALQNIYVYQSQPRQTFTPLIKAGEIGGQFDLYYQFKKDTPIGGKYGTYIALNGSYWNALGIDDVNVPSRDMSVGFLDFGRKYYNDIGFEVRKKFNEKFQSVFMYVSQYYNQKYIQDTYGEFITYIASSENIYKIGETKSIRFIAQHLWVDADKKNWAGATLEYTPNTKFSFFVHDIYNYGNDDPAQRIHYYNFGGSYVRGATRLAVSYGRQRGGLMCVGGVCRMVSEASGLTVNLTTNF